MPLDEYRRRFIAGLVSGRLGPGSLRVTGAVLRWVADGDTLCCACSREAAAAGRCHRVWSAEALVRAGWRVVIDGVKVSP
jgi:hypothetical protein